jgi:hypothetical protein
MIFSPRRQDAQVQYKTVGEAIEVGDGATRYDWSIAFSRICMRLPCKDRLVPCGKNGADLMNWIPGSESIQSNRVVERLLLLGEHRFFDRPLA